MRIIQAVIVAALLIPGIASATALSDAAATMVAGDWKECTGCIGGLKIPGATGQPWTILDQQASYGAGAWDTITGWSHKGTWDSQKRKVWFRSGVHVGAEKIIKYDDATNTWSKVDPGSGQAHGYDHSSINVIKREFHKGMEGLLQFSAWDLDTGAFKYNSTSKDTGQGNIAAAYMFQDFPDRNEIVFAANRNGVWTYNLNTSAWTHNFTGYPTCAYKTGFQHGISNYSPVHKVVVFGGGDSDSEPYCTPDAESLKSYFRYNLNGTLTELTNSPVTSADVSPPTSIFTVDPVSGDFILLNGSSSPNSWYQLNPTGSGTWTSLGSVPIIYNYGDSSSDSLGGTIAIPIDTYGVIMFLAHNRRSPNNPKVFLYKHSSGPPAPPGDLNSPTSPTGLVVQ